MIDDDRDDRGYDEPIDPADDLLLYYERGPTGGLVFERGRLAVTPFFVDRDWSADELLTAYEGAKR